MSVCLQCGEFFKYGPGGCACTRAAERERRQRVIREQIANVKLDRGTMKRLRQLLRELKRKGTK